MHTIYYYVFIYKIYHFKFLDGDPEGPWCYTTDERKTWDRCVIRECQDTKQKFL